jgi:hypothetical protein
MNHKIKNIKDFINDQSNNEYLTIANTLKYGLVKFHNQYRIENYKGLYQKEVPYIEIPEELANQFIDYLINYKDFEITKIEGKLEFNKYCDNMFTEEYIELYLN